MSNISSLGDLRKKEEGGKPSDKDAKKRNELFIGGLDQRGGGSGLGKPIKYLQYFVEFSQHILELPFLLFAQLF